MKGFKTVFTIVMMVCLYALSALAANLSVIDEARVDGYVIKNSSVETNWVSFVRGEKINIDLLLSSEEDLENVEIVGFISGYEFNHLERMTDSLRVFDMRANTTYRKSLSITVPTMIDDDQYLLRIIVSDRKGDTQVYEYKLSLDSPRHGFLIKDVVFSPGTVVEAGRALLTTVRIQNIGERSHKSVKVTVAIPELGISASDFIDRVEGSDDLSLSLRSGIDYSRSHTARDSATSEEMYMRIPVCAEPGHYSAVIEVRYNDLREAVYGNAIITVVESDACVIAQKPQDQPQTVIALGATSQKLVTGEAGALYPLTVTNNAKQAVAYTIAVEGTNDFASVQINPVSTFVLNAGDSQAVFLYLTPLDNAAEGQRVFTVSVKSENEVLKQIPLTANVEAGAKKTDLNVRDALEVGLIVLVVLLIILAVIVGVKKLKKDDDSEDDEEVEGKTYY
jgi:hypothetical protein